MPASAFITVIIQRIAIIHDIPFIPRFVVVERASSRALQSVYTSRAVCIVTVHYAYNAKLFESSLRLFELSAAIIS